MDDVNQKITLEKLESNLSKNEKSPVSSPSKVPAIVLTNTNDLDSLNLLSSDTQQSPAILYENDFDLYTMLKEMVKSPQMKPRRRTIVNEKDENNKSKKFEYQNYTKHLTAQLNDISYTDGKNRWLLANNYTPIYSKNIHCIGSNPDDFDLSESIFLDLQPLSTRIKLMCKLIIIIQGACIERFGPPKLVQDRCIQFDAERDIVSAAEKITKNVEVISKLTRVKSNSCEDLLLQVDDNDPNSVLMQNETKKTVIDKIGLKKGIQSEANSEDEKEPNSNKSQLYSEKQYDLDNYYRHRMSKYSLKDYASIPYYQYSGRRRKRVDIGVNTDQNIFKMLIDDTTTIENIKIEAIEKKDAFTSSGDLISDFYLGYYSKRQLLSDFSLRDVPSTLWNSHSNTSNEFENPIGNKAEYFYSYSKEYYINSSKMPPTHVSGLTVQTNPNEIPEAPDASKTLLDQPPPAPVRRRKAQKSSEWSMFNTKKQIEEKRQPIMNIKATITMPSHHQAAQRPPPLPPRHIIPTYHYPASLHRFSQQPPPLPPRPSSSQTTHISIATINPMYNAAKF